MTKTFDSPLKHRACWTCPEYRLQIPRTSGLQGWGGRCLDDEVPPRETSLSLLAGNHTNVGTGSPQLPAHFFAPKEGFSSPVLRVLSSASPVRLHSTRQTPSAALRRPPGHAQQQPKLTPCSLSAGSSVQTAPASWKEGREMEPRRKSSVSTQSFGWFLI